MMKVDGIWTAGFEVNRKHHQRDAGFGSVFIQEDVEAGWDQLGASRTPRGCRVFVPLLGLHWPDPESLIDY